VRTLLRFTIIGAIIGGGITYGFAHRLHRQKHTGPCTFTLRFTSRCYWFTRPNTEFFEMCFDNPPPLAVNTPLFDITYTDDNADLRHFVKAQIKK
jgi:hypothetical protein